VSRHPRLPKTKTCAACGGIITRGQNENSADWRKRRYCDKKCWLEDHYASEVDRFWQRVEKTDGCWLWRGQARANGYGEFSGRGERHRAAHRYSYQTFVGPIPDGMFVCHSCDNPACVRPDHLWVGTPADNVADMVAKGRQATDKRVYRGESNSQCKLSEDQVMAIRSEYRPRVVPQRELAKRYGVSQRLINKIIAREVWGHL
jgi:hypothetical protein